MIYKTSELSVCGDCLSWIVNGDASGLDYYYNESEASDRLESIKQGEKAIIGEYGNIHIDIDDEHYQQSSSCDCCGMDNTLMEVYSVETYTSATFTNKRNGLETLDPRFVTGVEVDYPEHSNANADGYGSRIKTRYILHCADNRKRRVYMMQYSNAGSAYVIYKGDKVSLGVDVEIKIDEATR